MPSIEAEFDVIVVGGGHAGTEAAVAAARLGARVALVTSALETIGQMSCNPAIGGVAKGTVVREVDALGGIMARATDAATLQFRMLNRSKGPAVWAPRAQCDRGLYRRAVRTALEAHPRLVTIQGTVARLILTDAGRRVAGIETLEGRRFGARAVVITTGTFLRGRIHIGTTTQIGGGRAGEAATTHLAEQLENAGLTVARFKTGTPPRIDGRSVDFIRVERQDSELAQFGYRWSHFSSIAERDTLDASRSTSPGDASVPRSAADGHWSLPQLPCWITHLEEPGKAIIASHIDESAMYGGAIASRGPRYCPSVEDKIVKFPDAVRHQLFLEPEGLETSELYVNGLSTSLPAEVQLAVLRTVRGLEGVRMTRAGYAIEYDYYPPTQLDLTFQVRALPGLWLAGQINGTTGYEEAAGQGMLAGLNAGLAALGRDSLVLGRETSYLGVLADDIITRGVDEPYRLFTSRSEFRLTVRQDNALRRLSPIAERLGLYDDGERARVHRRLSAEDELVARARATSIRPDQADAILVRAGSAPLAHAVRVAELVRRQGVGLGELLAAAGVPADDPDAVVTAELELKYEGYYHRERQAADRLRRMGGFTLDPELPYEAMRSLTIEARQKLHALRPMTLAQAARIPGITPADLQNLVIEVSRHRRGPASAAV
ncbi:MAG: tRNA uridine-5-carboxymethylaminomethyl(34) synthesis enzyme MnmG [Gemmatirosa sp.]|nr:tRNA uridine-5-carboxymethylaminomethyl(34) synthesis enzyme MnmG [Gemmatirosa sp.]